MMEEDKVKDGLIKKLGVKNLYQMFKHGMKYDSFKIFRGLHISSSDEDDYEQSEEEEDSLTEEDNEGNEGTSGSPQSLKSQKTKKKKKMKEKRKKKEKKKQNKKLSIEEHEYLKDNPTEKATFFD